ncbi:MAG: SBBP repeat-containing protein, partial [Candidatus Krumholzibacteria bacterium]|nr:SBBP repeat-containing protein [Candidatus Krumholzibacteria bacterium]
MHVVVVLAVRPASPQAVPSHQWSQRFGGTGTDNGYAIAVDATGAVFVTGSFSGTANFGGADLVSVGGNDIFLARYDANGQHLWSKGFGTVENDEGLA